MTTREIVLDGGSPWGFRMHGGADVGQPLRISRVNPGSKAAQRGIREGDVISSINGQPTRGISNSDAHALLRNAGQTLHLGLNEECGGSPKRRAHRSSQQQQQQQQEVTKHSSQQSTSRFPGSVNGVTDQNYNTVTNRGKDDVGTEVVSSSDTKGKRRQKQSGTTQHSLAPPLQEESPGSSAVSSDVKEEPTAPSSKSKKRKRNRRKNRAQHKLASGATEDENASQASAASTNVEELDTSNSVGPSIESSISQPSTVVETDMAQQNCSRKVEERVIPQPKESSKDATTQSSATLGTDTVQQKCSYIKNINNSQSTEPPNVTEMISTLIEVESIQKSLEDADALKSSSPTLLNSSNSIKEDKSLRLSEVGITQQTSCVVQPECTVSSNLVVAINAEDCAIEVLTEPQLNSAHHAETVTETNLSSHHVIHWNEYSGSEDKLSDGNIETNKHKESNSNIVHQGVANNGNNSETGEKAIHKKVQDDISTASLEKVNDCNVEYGGSISSSDATVMVNVHNKVSSQEEVNAHVEQTNSVQEGKENSSESLKRDVEVVVPSNLEIKKQATVESLGDHQRLPETTVQATSYQSSVECRAVVVETVDEEVWQEVVEFSVEGIHDPGVESCPLTSNTVTLQQYELTEEDEELLDPRPLIDAEEEETLRNFLYSLNLADYGRDSPRRGKRRSSHDAACNPVHHQGGLEVIMEENSSEISDSGDSKRGKGWKDAVYIPGTNEVVYLNEDSADEGEYTTEETSSKMGNCMKSLYYAETTATLTTEGASNAEMREFIYRTVGEAAKDEEDVFSAHMERMLEADAENGLQITELMSDAEEDKEDVVTTQKTEEKQSGVEVVFVEDDTTSTSSGAPANWEDVEDTPYEDVVFPVQGQPKYIHRREDSIYENVEVNFGRGPEDETVYENVDFSKRDAQEHVSFSTSSSEPKVSRRHLTSLVPPEQQSFVGESPEQVQQESDEGQATSNSGYEVSTRHVPPEQQNSVGKLQQAIDKGQATGSCEREVSSKHLNSLLPSKQEVSVGESPKQVQHESDNRQDTSNSGHEISTKDLNSLVAREHDTPIEELPKPVQEDSDKGQTTSNCEPEVSSQHLNSLFPPEQQIRESQENYKETKVSSHYLNCLVLETTESVEKSVEPVQQVNGVEDASLSTSNHESRVSGQRKNYLVPVTVGEFQEKIQCASVSNPRLSNLSENDLIPQQESGNIMIEVQGSSHPIVPPIVSGRHISENIEGLLAQEEPKQESEGQDSVEDGRDSITPTNNQSRRGSSSSDDTASHGTAFYCPVDAHSPALSSDADISSLTEEVPEARRKKVQPSPPNAKSPLSLKDLCIARVVSIPYGTYILNILGVRPHATPVRESPRLPDEPPVVNTPLPSEEQWLGTPTLDDPTLLVCLSPSQRKVYNEEVPSPDEMQSLLDLHCKFLQRRGYHEKPPPLPPSRKYRPLTSPRGDTKISPTSRSSRLLAILREASEQEKVTPPPLPPPPDMSSCCNTAPPAERLKVRSLSDWLQLVRCAGGGANDNTNGARNKDSTPPILSTQSSPGTVRRFSQSGNHVVRCGVNENTNGAQSKDSTPILSTQSSPGAVRRSLPGQSEPWYVGRSAKENASGSSSPILSTQSSPGAVRRSVPHPEEEQLPPVPVRAQENRRFDADNYRISKRGDIAVINTPRPQQEDRSLRPRSLPPPSEALVTGGEIFRQQMYLEYMRKVAERSERRRQRVIRLSSVPREDDMTTTESAGGPLENEFMDKVRERMDKLGIRYDDQDGDDDRQNGGGELPKHLQEFLALTDTAEDVNGVWSPSQKSSSDQEQDQAVQQKEKVGEGADDAPPVVWTPKSAGASPTTERKEFRPIKFESPTLSRKNRSGTSTPAPKTSDGSCSEVENVTTATTTAATTTTTTTTFSSTFQPWQTRDDSTLISSEQRVTSSSSSTLTTTATDRRLVQSQSAPASGLSSLAAGPASTKLPRAQNPTITLLQKAREGQLPKGALYLDHKMNSKEGENAYISPNEILYSVKKEYESEGQNSQRKKIVELTPRKFEGIGPTTEEGVPTVLRSEVKDANQAKWYKRMYDSLHRAGKDDDYITIRYKTRKGQYPYTSPGGYLSEPEPACYDSDIGFSAKYATLDRRRIKNKENDFTTSTLPRSRYVPHPSSIKYATQVYKNQPGRIEDYEPGRSSISEKETKQWWDEVLDIFDGWLESYSPHHPTYRSSSQLTTKADAITTTTMYQQRATAEQQTNQSTSSNKTFMTHALKDGYESDSTLVFKRRDENLQSQLSPAEQKQAYKTIQKGGEVPLHGLRKPAPERPKDISEIEYFPISAHLTRIRVHKQHVTPLREIVCYPVTASYNNNVIPPVFSTYKRTAPSYSQVQQTRKPPPLPPPPPSPPKRLSSHHSSALRLWTHVPRHRHEACFSRETNVSFLRDRLSHKLGVKTRTASSSPVVSRTKATPRSRSAPEERQLGRKKPDHQETTAAWLNQVPDLSSPHEVRKALQRQKDVRERPGTKGLPPGTIIRSSTTPYASVRNAAHLPEDKALKVTVAISAKGRELLRPRAHSSLSSLRTTSKPGTPSPEGTRSPSTSSPVSQTSGKAKAITSRSSSVSSSSGKKSTKTTTLTEPSRMTKSAAMLLAQDAGNRRVQKTNNKKTVKEKTPLTGAKTSASPKVCSKLLASKAKEEKETNKRKTKKVKTDGESPVDAKRPSGTKVNSNSSVTRGKSNSADKKKAQVTEKNVPSVTGQQNPAPKSVVGQQQGPLHTDSFFQHLLLRDMPSPTPSITSSLCRSSAVFDKVQKFHELVTARSRTCHRTDASLGLLNVYLAQKKPVTESKFRSLEREHSRSPSPSHRTIRTRFSDLSSRHNTEDGAFYSFCPSRSRTPDAAGAHALKIRSCSEPPPASLKSEMSDIATIKREKPPLSHRCHSPVSSTSSRSPSYRRIRSAHCHGSKPIESIAGVKRKGPRAHSAGEAEARLKEDQPLARSVSSLNIADHAEYQTYVMELVHSTKKSERFRELHNFYASLERLGQLEKTTSTGDLRPRLKGEEVIDYDRWKRLRTKERAEEELKVLYRKLKEAQKEKDLFFQPKDVESVRWRGDRGLRCKEKSVEDLKEQYGKLCKEDSDVGTKRKQLDVYKPLWRGSSVLNLVTNLSSATASRRGRPVIAKEHHGVSKSVNRPPPGRYGRGIGCRLWSSLSMDQVNALKTQLNEIYSSVSGIKRDPDEYEITVDDKVKKDTLHVRCNSLLSRDQLYSPMVRRKEARRIESMKADSISSMPHGDQAKALSETEKKRLSLTLSQEVLDRVTKKHKRVASPRETLGAIAAAAAAPKTKPKSASPILSETASPRTCYSLEMSEEDGGSTATRKNDFLLVLTPSNGSQSQQKEVEKVVEEWANSRQVCSNGFTAKPAVTTSTSETESASSDASTRTVIHREDVSQKEEKTTRVSRSASDIRPAHQELTSTNRAKSAPGAITVSPAKPSSKLHSSQSFADLKDIFGEQSRLRYSSESPTRRCCSSSDSGRSGSLSPDTSWRSYLKMVKSGDVRRLKEKFESLEELCEEQRRLRKHKSDPELTRQRQVVVRRQEIGDVRWLRRRYENTCCRGRRKTRVSSPVLRHPIRLEDRFMPHINVISKTAALQQQSRSVTPTSLPDDGYHTGEVQRLRRKFEALPQLSLMGQMFTSTPDVRELRDIAPYLECHWVAHRYPDPGGGSPRSLSSPELRPAPPTPTRTRPSSSSPCTRSQPLSSILKQQQQQRAKDIFANQSFDPSKHRPVYRYQPADVDWHRSRPTVTFKESPHRYVESEVTIHYRSPVRSEAKEALSEEELARRQAEAMRRIYQEERRRKYLQELQDMHSRRHTDNFTPSQKSPIPLNRYDDFFDDVGNKSKSRDRTPEPKLVARALYNFVGQTSRELSFRRGDIIFVRRQIDKNWYEGEHNAMVGLFPFNYVEIIPYDGIRTIPKRPTEGQACAKFNFIAQTHLELSLVKGELVVLTRRVDDNWFEGRIGNRKGIFPVSYVEVLQEPGEKPVTSSAPPSKPASHTTLMNGTGIKQSMGSHSYQPSFYYSHNKTSSPYTSTNPYATMPRQSQLSKQSLAPVNQTLHIDTHSEPVPYRALYNYRPQNEDELELCEGDTVYVMEKCDDGWYVGSSQRTGYFGTFPGNYVERI